jgi:uncharacterized protein (UPF0332 family)
MRHPAKKKHPNKPRPDPVIPLSDLDRLRLSNQEFQKALIHLAEAEKLAEWGQAPNACVHSAYYAMEHCAAAALLANGGVGKRKDVPKSHEHLIEHFGKLVEGKPGTLGDCGRMLSRARTDRMTADYNLVESVSDEDARDTTSEARKFMDACAAVWRLGSDRQA